MAYTFGASTDDCVSISLIDASGVYEPFLWCGWFYPTTLTAGRYYLGSGSVDSDAKGLRIDTTNADEIAVVFDSNLHEWVSSDANITTDKWWFIAALTNRSGTGANCVAWLGDGITPPRRLTLAQNGATFPQGSPNLVIGNSHTSSPTSSFEGDIGQVSVVYGTGGVTSLLTLTSALATSVVDWAYARYVVPLWMGCTPAMGDSGPDAVMHFIHWSGLAGSYMQHYGFTDGGTVTTSYAYRATTYAGSVAPSSRRPPRPYLTSLTPLRRR